MKSNIKTAISKNRQSRIYKNFLITSFVYKQVFGYDIFISYSRADAANYALNLANELTEKGYACFVDQLKTTPNEELPDELIKILNHSATFTLLGTKGAIASRFVSEEIDEFLKTRRPIVIIDFDGVVDKALENANWKSQLKGLPMTPESNESLIKGKPSPSVINRFVFPKRFRRMKIGFYISMTVTLLISVVASFFSITVLKNATAQLQAANEQVAVANEKLREAEVKVAFAEETFGKNQVMADDAAKRRDMEEMRIGRNRKITKVTKKKRRR